MLYLPEAKFFDLLWKSSDHLDITIIGEPGAWVIVADYPGDQTYVLERQRGGPRIFKSLDTVVAYLMHPADLSIDGVQPKILYQEGGFGDVA